jgi:hypothetical protein
MPKERGRRRGRGRGRGRSLAQKNQSLGRRGRSASLRQQQQDEGQHRDVSGTALTVGPQRPEQECDHFLDVPSQPQAQGEGQCHQNAIHVFNTPNVDVLGINIPLNNIRAESERPGSNADPPGAPTGYSKFGAPLGKFVPLATKEKIWRGEFVELGVLMVTLEPKQDATPLSFCQIGGQVCFKPLPRRSKPITDIDQWTSAFFIFMSIFLERHPNRAIELIKYADLIRKFAANIPGRGWLNYDKDFRLSQGMEPSRSWASYDSDLFLEKLAMPVYSQNQHFF